MAKLPSRSDISQPTSGRSGRAIATFDTSGLGRGIESLGNSISEVGATVKRDQVATEIIGADGPATKERHDFVRSFDQDADYSTFSPRAEKGLNAIRDKHAARITDKRARQEWIADFDRAAEGDRNRIADLGDRRVREGRLVDAKNGLQSYQSLIADNTIAGVDRAKAKATAEASISALQSEGLLTPDEADQWRENIIKGGDFVYGQREIERNGAAALGGGDVVDRIIGVESGGNANAKNPNSSATGLGQFIDSTWMDTVKAHRPDILAGRSTEEVLELRKDPSLAREMTQYLIDDNKAFLRNQGIAASDGDTYLAHFLGPRGAAQVIKADPSAPVGDVVGQAVVNANSFLKGMTTAQVRAWADKKMGAPARPDWYLAQSPEKQLQLENMAASRDREIATAAVTQQKANAVTAVDDYQLRIATSDPTLTQQQILTDDRIDNGQRATLINSFNKEQESNAGAAEIIAAIGAGQQAPINAYDADQAKVAEKAYGQMIRSLPEDQQAAGTNAFVSSTGFIPKSIEANLRNGAASTDPQTVASTMTTASVLSRLAPSNFGSMPGADGLRKKMDLYQTYTATMGYTPTEAGAKIIAADDPDQIRRRDAILKSDPVKKYLKAIDANDVASIFNTGAFGSVPLVGKAFAPDVGGGATPDQIKVGVNPESEAAIVSDYRRVVEDALVEANGDEAAAEDIAKRRFSRIYGTTEYSPLSSNIVVRYPPENAYPAGPDGTHEYVGSQLSEALKEEGIEADAYYLQGDLQTEQDIKAGRPARYQVFYEKDGKIESFNLPFYADVNIAKQRAAQDAANRLSNAETRMIEGRDTFIEDTAADQKAYDETPGPDWMKAQEMMSGQELRRQNETIDALGGEQAPINGGGGGGY